MCLRSALGIEDKLPDHSVFSRARPERLRESNALRQVFERVVAHSGGIGRSKPDAPQSQLASSRSPASSVTHSYQERTWRSGMKTESAYQNNRLQSDKSAKSAIFPYPSRARMHFHYSIPLTTKKVEKWRT